MIDLLCFHLFAFIGYLRYLLCHLYRCFVLRHSDDSYLFSDTNSTLRFPKILPKHPPCSIKKGHVHHEWC